MSTEGAKDGPVVIVSQRRPVGPLAPLELSEKMQHSTELKSDEERDLAKEEHKGEE